MAAILNFIADHPGQAFTLTDLVRALKLSRATCHALLTGLVEVGYLYRASDKNYILGPALASIGRIAAQHASPLQVAQPEMRALADEFDLICAAFFRERDDVVLRDRATSVSHVSWSVPVGSRLKLRPGFGSIFHAWLPEAEYEAWLDGYDPAPTADQRRLVRRASAFLREHRYAVHLRNPELSHAEPAPGRAYGDSGLLFPTLPIGELDDAASYSVDAILSPVFELGGQIAFVLALAGFNRTLSGAEIRAMGVRLADACNRVSSFVTGQSRASAAA